MEKIKRQINDIPKLPGVYQFKNKDGEVIYIGKAKNLRNRISQYLSGKDERPQLPYLMAEASDIAYTVVNNELESLYLENTLIKQYLPKYNIQLRDDKNYAFITVDYTTQIPQIGTSRKIDRPAGQKPQAKRYFGPYSAAYKIRNTLNLMRRIFPYCSATEIGARPCFYYYLHRCPGVCVGKITPEEYRQHLDKICAFLSGDTKKIKKQLTAEMKIAALQHEFEKAARLRNQLQALELLEERQTVILAKKVDWDIISLFSDQGYTCINLFKIREGKLYDKENFTYEDAELPQTAITPAYENEILQNFLEQYYSDTSSLPKTIYIEAETEDPKLIERIIESRANKKIKVLVPQKNKPRDLVELGKTNAAEYLKQWLTNQAGHLDKINNALRELKNALGMEKTPERIECYDISNIQGTNAVGSMVVFKNGLPAKSEYRKFKIKYNPPAGGPDDFAMMKEMLTRRIERIPNSKSQTTNDKPVWPAPDLIVIDGGKGQLSAALEVLQKFQISNIKFQIPTIGLAKRIEEIFLPEKSDPVILPHDNPGLQLLQRLRDETHRFGITFHRQLRSKQAIRSALDDIPGIGPKTKKLLKQKFGTVANIRKASFNDLAGTVGERIARLLQQSL